jgi:archaellum biogenesis protein FlaJ (TadC family)
METEGYRKLALKWFGKTADRSLKHFEPLRQQLQYANMGILLRSWVSMIFLTTLLVYGVALAASAAAAAALGPDLLTAVSVILFVPLLAAAGTFLVFYTYPVQKAKRIRKSIDRNLPFALTHMSAIASSGIPPELMFELLTKFDEYGEVSRQASMIVRNIKTFGMSSVLAIREVSQRTPSFSFKQILNGIDSTIEKGGNLTEYLDEMAEKVLFDYRIKREKYLKTLSTYADIYTALLIAAPLMMLSILGILSVIGGDIAGFGVKDLMVLITLGIIPLLNIGFLLFIHVTHPGV